MIWLQQNGFLMLLKLQHAIVEAASAVVEVVSAAIDHNSVQYQQES